MVAKMLEIGIIECFKNHMYRFKGSYYVQRKGGSIGLRLTGVVAEICMARWENRFRVLLMKNEVTLWMSKVYVDDQDLERGVGIGG